MPKGLQVVSAKRHLAQKGINPDLVDVEALIDSDLSYEENWKRIKKHVGISKKKGPKSKKSFKQVESEQTIQQALMYHEMRSERAQAIDEELKAKVPKDLDKWFKNPALYDLPGVDLGSKKVKHKPKKKSKKR